MGYGSSQYGRTACWSSRADGIGGCVAKSGSYVEIISGKEKLSRPTKQSPATAGAVCLVQDAAVGAVTFSDRFVPVQGLRGASALEHVLASNTVGSLVGEIAAESHVVRLRESSGTHPAHAHQQCRGHLGMNSHLWFPPEKISVGHRCGPFAGGSRVTCHGELKCQHSKHAYATTRWFAKYCSEPETVDKEYSPTPAQRCRGRSLIRHLPKAYLWKNRQNRKILHTRENLPRRDTLPHGSPVFSLSYSLQEGALLRRDPERQPRPHPSRMMLAGSGTTKIVEVEKASTLPRK
jgi:hypothetical protein